MRRKKFTGKTRSDMTTRYYLPCACGDKLLVETIQAGESLACSVCGAEQVVPTLRRLRELAVVADNQSDRAVASSWTALQGTLFLVGSVVTIVSVAAIVFLTVTHRKLSVKAADLPSEQLIFEDLADLTPEESWLDWQTLRQLPPRRLSPYGRAETNWQFYRNVAAGLALTGVAVAGLASIVRR